jgi:hypothetical protein
MHILLHRATVHRVISIEYHIIEIHPSDCITPSPPPVSVSVYFKVVCSSGEFRMAVPNFSRDVRKAIITSIHTYL